MCREAEERRRKAELRAKRADDENKRKVRTSSLVMLRTCSGPHFCGIQAKRLCSTPCDSTLAGDPQEAVQQADERERKRKQDAARMQVW